MQTFLEANTISSQVPIIRDCPLSLAWRQIGGLGALFEKYSSLSVTTCVPNPGPPLTFPNQGQPLASKAKLTTPLPKAKPTTHFLKPRQSHW